MTTKVKYEITTETMGILQPQEVVVVHMPRMRFLELVNEMLQPEYEDIAPQMRLTALEMERFPLAAWFNPTRGCGCLVGEFLVAQHIIDDRGAWLAENAGASSYDLNINVLRLVRQQPNGDQLAAFGSAIDRKLRGEIGHGDTIIQAIVIDN